jgi:hypothetical protein
MPELTRRYIVMAMATEGPFDMRDPEAAFVLKPWKDPAALKALETYRDHAYPELARELTAWIEVIQKGPVVRGGVGKRNEEHMKSQPRAAAPAARPRGKVKSKAKSHKMPTKKGKRH